MCIRDSSANVQRADELFRQAKALTDSGTYDGACPKLEESRRLDPVSYTHLDVYKRQD